jgi:BED zinc finger.
MWNTFVLLSPHTFIAHPSPRDACEIKMPPMRNQPLKQTTLPFARPFNQLSPSPSTSINDTSSQSTPATPTIPITQTESTRTESTRRSWVWLHGSEYFDRQGQKRWRCNFCPNRSTAQTYADGSTSHMGNHLKRIHQVYEEGEIPTDQTTIETCTKSTIKPEVLRKLIVEWIIDRRHAFNEIEAESFHKLIGYIDKAALSFVPRSGNTVLPTF